MLIELRKALHPGTLNAVIAPGKVMVSALNTNTDLQRFRILFMSGDYTRLLSSINPAYGNFDARRAFTVAHRFFTKLKEADRTVALPEYDSTLFDWVETMLPQIAGMLKEIGCESLMIPYIPSVNRAFSVLMRQADDITGITAADDIRGTTLHYNSSTPRYGGFPPYSQQTWR
jgi:DNA polymerase I